MLYTAAEPTMKGDVRLKEYYEKIMIYDAGTTNAVGSCDGRDRGSGGGWDNRGTLDLPSSASVREARLLFNML